MIHKLKTWPEPFSATKHGQKKFEYRRNDRGFKVGDLLELHEWDPKSEKYTGQVIQRGVGYVLHGPGFDIPDGFCVMSLV